MRTFKQFFAALAGLALSAGMAAAGSSYSPTYNNNHNSNYSASTSTAIADSSSEASSSSRSGASSHANVFNVNKNAPAVSAPSMVGGGHPCLKGGSGGLSVVGGGFSLGTNTADPVCMLWVMGQPEAAIHALASSSKKACEALNQVGYMRVGNQLQKFECGKGGATNTASAAAPAADRPQQRPYKSCRMNDDGKLVVRPAAGVSKGAASSACLSAWRAGLIN